VGGNGQQTTSLTWRDKTRLLRTVPGVSPVLRITIVAALPELGLLGRKQIAALMGLAPHNCERAGSMAVASSGAVVGESVQRCT
jgi:transposase